MPPTKPVDELKAKAIALISERVSQTSVAKVASDLGITRQAVYGFLKGAFCPSLAVIHQACLEWHAEFDVRGLKINQQTLRASKTPAAPLPRQLDLDLYQILKTKRFVVKTRKTGNAMELVLRFKISA